MHGCVPRGGDGGRKGRGCRERGRGRGRARGPLLIREQIVSPTLFDHFLQGSKECGGCGGHSLPPSYKGSKSVGDTLCPLLWGLMCVPHIMFLDIQTRFYL